MKSILVIDSGSTKTDWAYISKNNIKQFRTRGINPSADIHMPDIQEESFDLYALRNQVKEIFYYGAGVIDTYTTKIICDWLKTTFKNALVKVQSDMIGACKATANNSPGIVSILGTGSNSCLYDGMEIKDNIPALGYSLSNEGGGSKIGASLLRSYFYRQMPGDVKEEFENNYQVDRSTIVHALYKEENPTAYLAKFAKFVNKTKNLSWRKSLLSPLFQEFIDIRIKSYPEYSSYDLYFVGSIAYFCQDVIKEVLQENNLRSTQIIRKPIDGLIAFHKRD